METASFIAAETGTVYVTVDNASDVDASSRFKVEVTDNSLVAGSSMSGPADTTSMYYRFDSNGGAFTIELTAVTGDVHLSLWAEVPSAGGTPIDASTNLGSDSVTLSAPTVSDLPYYIEVSPVDFSNSYTISVTQ